MLALLQHCDCVWCNVCILPETGFIVGFTFSWDLTLVIIGCLPFLVAMGILIDKFSGKHASMSQKLYTEVCHARWFGHACTSTADGSPFKTEVSTCNRHKCSVSVTCIAPDTRIQSLLQLPND